MQWRPYRNLSTTTIRGYIHALNRRGLRFFFADRIAQMELELLMRDLAGIAEESGGHCVAEIVGLQ